MGLTVSPIALEKGITAVLMRRAVQSRSDIIDKLAMVTTSTSDEEKHGYLSDIPAMREFLNERIITGLNESSYVLVNKTFEMTIGFKKDDLDDQKSGMFDIRINQMGQRAANHPVKLLIEVLELGTTDISLDGVSFYNDAHPQRGHQTGTQDNLLAGTGTTVAQLKTDFGVAVAALKNFEDEGGEPFDEFVTDLVVVCSPDIEVNFTEALESELISNTSNAIKGRADIIISARLTDVDDWYLLSVGGLVKPLVFQDRMPLMVESQENQSESGFMRRIFVFGVSARYNVGYGLWQLTVKTVN